jgi:cytochrome c553
LSATSITANALPRLRLLKIVAERHLDYRRTGAAEASEQVREKVLRLCRRCEHGDGKRSSHTDQPELSHTHFHWLHLN